MVTFKAMGAGRTFATLLVAVFLCLVAAKGSAEPTPVPLVDFRIKDQFDNLHTSGYFQRSLVVFDRQGKRRLQISVTTFDPEIQAEILRTICLWAEN